MKRIHVAVAVATVFAFSFGAQTVLTQRGQGRGAGGPAQPPAQWWVAKDKPGQYGNNKPHIKLADLKAKHAGQATWNETVVDDINYHAEYNAAPPGTKVSPRARAETREFWVVIEGEIHFNLAGQDPIVATRGSIVQAPRRTLYSFEVAGTGPALWIDVNQQHYKTLFPADGAAPASIPGATPGSTIMKVGFTLAPAPYTGNNKPHFNLHEAEKNPQFSGQNVVQDDHMWAQAIWGYEKNLPPYDPTDKGHFHMGTAEWWIIMESSIRHNIETVGDFTSSEGDVAYVPPGTWHATRFSGPGPSCRLAISGVQFTNMLELKGQ